MNKKPTCPLCGMEVKIDEGQHDKDDFSSHYVSFACFNPDDHNLTVNYFGITQEEALKRFTTRPESAWEMFRRLVITNAYDFYRLLCKKMKDDNLNNSVAIFQEKPEQEAISIMQQIEKELKDD